ncbi:replicative DNA helicase, partial [bacterium]
MPQELVLEKLPPQSIEAEMAVLGSMLIDEEAIAQAIEMLSAEHFYKDAHRRIYACILSLFNQNKAVDLITICDELKKQGILEEVEGPSYLTSLVNTVPTSANVLHYASIVREKATLRALINNSTHIISEAYAAEGNVDEVVDNAERLIFEIRDHRQSSAIVPLKEIIKDSI